MACPYFHPVRPLGSGLPYPPLGDVYEGDCHRDPTGPFHPDLACLRDLCNLGYARGRCPRFDAGPDAVRFAVSSDDGARIRVKWVIEKDYLPLAHGMLEWAEGFLNPPGDGMLLAQARAYLQSYLRRRKT